MRPPISGSKARLATQIKKKKKNKSWNEIKMLRTLHLAESNQESNSYSNVVDWVTDGINIQNEQFIHEFFYHPVSSCISD